MTSRAFIHLIEHSMYPHRLRWWVMACAFALGTAPSLGQAFVIFNGTDQTCTGAFLDSGGQGGSGYGNNEAYTYTLCPDNPGDAISVDFITFNLSTAGAAPLDVMTIHDGNTTAASLIGSYTGSMLQGQVISASNTNPTGCLTFVWSSNALGTGVFAASISCFVPCDRPIAAATVNAPLPARICVGDVLDFNGSSSTAAPGAAIVTYNWDLGDGTTSNAGPLVSHAYTTPGEHVVQLQVLDNNGCSSANLTDLVVQVGTTPNFLGTSGDPIGCLGEELCLNGIVNATTWNELPDADFGAGVYLPDNVGSCFTSELYFNQFAPGQTLTNVNQLLSICLDIEHSFIGDLVISIIAPTGETVVLHQQGGGGTFLGDANDLDNNINPVPGTCWTYCFSPLTNNGTWVDNSQFGATPNVVPSSQGTALAPGTYESLQPLNGLLGAQLNGLWTIEICDLWAADNGFLCAWELAFDPALYPDLTEFTPIYGAGCDSSSWSGGGIVTTSPDCNAICVIPGTIGDHDYTFTVTDDFGCTYDTTITVTVVPDPVVDAGPDQVTCTDPVQLNATASGGLSIDCDYTLEQFDSFGDGWNGGQVTITINGVASTYTLNNGSFGSISLPVSSGDALQVNYQSGFFNFEVSFSLLDGNGNVVYSAGPGPANGQLWSGTANCGGQTPNYTYSWSPTTGLSDPTIADPVATVSSTTTYCVTVTQTGHPECSDTDCMTVTVDPGVDPGLDGAITVCSIDGPIDLFAQLGGTPDPGGTWYDPNAQAFGPILDPSIDPSGTYLYVVTGVGNCGASTDTSAVVVTISQPPLAGTDAVVALCDQDPPVALFALLGGASAGGTWTAPGGGAFNGTLDPATDLPGTYTYSVTGTAPCPDDQATVSVTINAPPSAGTDALISLCTTDGPEDLFTLLGGADPGGSWTAPGGGAFTGTLDPATDLPGVYTYTVTGTAPCPDDQATVSVTINAPPSAGTDALISLCTTDGPEDLFTLLGGADPGGSWTAPGGGAFNGTLDPATDLPGTYTYTVNGTAPCPDDQATVTVTINTPPSAGTDAVISLCTTDGPEDLFALLGGADPGGSWTAPGGGAFNGTLDPATDLPGVYTYTVTGTAPCPDDQATVSVTINAPPAAGTDAVISLCITDGPEDLFALLGGADPGGSWTAPGGGAFTGTLDPATDLPGVYTYTVNGTSPCPDDQATVTVTINTPPEAGTDAVISLCTTDGPEDLFALLGGADPGGSWTAPGGGTFNGLLDPATDLPGTYTYTVTGTAPCPDDQATVSVSINALPNAGTDAVLALCISSPPTALLPVLGGNPDPNGTWSGPGGVAFTGTFDPAIHAAGVHTYTVPGTAPCPNDQSTVTISIVTFPDPGLPTTVQTCSSDAPFLLFDALAGTPDPGGTWTGPGGSVPSGVFDPATDLPGTYTYLIAVPPPCVSVSSTVEVDVIGSPDPGIDGATTLCISSPPQTLFNALGGTPEAGGTWTDPNGLPFGGIFDPALDVPGNYTYTVAGTAPCPDAEAIVAVAVVSQPDPGTPGNAILCTSGAPKPLLPLLGGTPDPGGTWTAPGGLPFSGTFDPAVDPAGVYTYTLNVPPPCVSQSSTVTIVLNAPPDPGSDGAATLCISSPPQALFNALGGTPEAGGTWTDPNGLPFGGLFDPALDIPGNYTYTVIGTAPCPDAEAIVTVSVVSQPDPGTPGSASLCASGVPQSLFSLLGGTPDPGGTWAAPGGLPFSGTFDPAVDMAGVYTYTLNVPPPCVSQSSTVTIILNAPPDPGTDGATTLCISSPPQVLFNALGGTPDAGGIWTDPNGLPFGGLFDPALDIPGDYTYNVAGTAPCPDAEAIVTVAVVSQPDPGLDAIMNLCLAGNPEALFPALGGSPDPGGSWTDPNGLVFSGVFDPGFDVPGAYVYNLSAPPPCPSAQSTVLVNVVTDPDARSDGSMTVCGSFPAVVLFDLLGGSPNSGGQWSDPFGSPHNGSFDPTTDPPGAYMYIVTVPPPCVNDTSIVHMTIVAPPDPGIDGQLTVCAADGPFALVQVLGGTPDAGGTWTTTGGLWADSIFDPAMDPSGVFIHTVTGSTPCPDASASVTITVEPLPDPGSDGSMVLCPDAPPVVLFDLLGGTPDPGGTWTDPQGLPFAGIFDPATDPAGSYTYELSGQSTCPDSSATAVVTLYVVAPPDAGPDTVVCDLYTVLQASGTGPSGSWSGPNWVVLADSASPSTLATADHGGAAVLVWSNSDVNGCASMDSVTILFTDPITAQESTTDVICAGNCDGSATVSVTGGNGPGYTYLWSNAVAGPLDSAAWALCAGTYQVSVADTNGCSMSLGLVIDEPPPLIIDQVSSVDETCPGSCDGSIAMSDPEGLLFSIDGGATFQAASGFTGLCAGDYDLVMQDANGCLASTSAVLVPPPSVVADFMAAPDTVLISDPLVQFIDLSDNAVLYDWDFAGLGSSQLQNPEFLFPDGTGGTYTVCLTATNANGCSDSICQVVVVLDLVVVHVPNAFTPDGDGINDGFVPILNEPGIAEEYAFLVFDRWGEVLFESDRPGEAWNGAYKGNLVEQEVYVWKLEFRDGRSLKRQALYGHVTVVR